MEEGDTQKVKVVVVGGIPKEQLRIMLSGIDGGINGGGGVSFDNPSPVLAGVCESTDARSEPQLVFTIHATSDGDPVVLICSPGSRFVDRRVSVTLQHSSASTPSSVTPSFPNTDGTDLPDFPDKEDDTDEIKRAAPVFTRVTGVNKPPARIGSLMLLDDCVPGQQAAQTPSLDPFRERREERERPEPSPELEKNLDAVQGVGDENPDESSSRWPRSNMFWGILGALMLLGFMCMIPLVGYRLVTHQEPVFDFFEWTPLVRDGGMQQHPPSAEQELVVVPRIAPDDIVQAPELESAPAATPPPPPPEPRTCTKFTMLHENKMGPEPSGCFVVGCSEGYAEAMVWKDGSWDSCEPYYRPAMKSDNCALVTDNDKSTHTATLKNGEWTLKRCK